MEMFAVIVVLVIIGFGVGAAASSQKRSVANTVWRSAASNKGLLFKPAEFLSGPEIVGWVKGCRVKVDTVTRGGDSSKKFTRFLVEYPDPLNMGLKLTEQGVMSGVTKLLGSQDIEVGDEWFDQAVLVKGRNPEQVVEFLSGPRRELLLAFFAEYPGSEITDMEITWEKSGVIEVTSGILNPVERMVQLARALSTDSMDVAETAERSSEIPATEIVLDEPVELPAPPPLEASVQGGSELPEARVIELPPESGLAEAEPVDVPGPQEEPVPAEIDSNEPPADQLSAQTVAEALFSPSVMSYQAREVFEESFQGRPVLWSGTLMSVAHYPFDRVFGHTPGTKAVVKVHEPVGSTGKQSVQAVVQLAHETLSELRPAVGNPVAFEGTLVQYDGFMNSVFVGDGRIVWAGGE